MKKTLLIFALAALASCGGRGQNKTAAGGGEQPTAQSEQSAEGGYVRVSGAAVGSFELRGGTEYLFQTDRDAWFSTVLLGTLDTALMRHNYTVEIRNDSIAAPGRDTIRITIYDFRAAAVAVSAAPAANAEVAAKLNAAFSDTALVERFIGVLKLSYTAVYFMRGDDLGVIVREGFPFGTEFELGGSLESGTLPDGADETPVPDFDIDFSTTPRPEELKQYVLHQSL